MSPHSTNNFSRFEADPVEYVLMGVGILVLALVLTLQVFSQWSDAPSQRGAGSESPVVAVFEAGLEHPGVVAPMIEHPWNRAVQERPSAPLDEMCDTDDDDADIPWSLSSLTGLVPHDAIVLVLRDRSERTALLRAILLAEAARERDRIGLHRIVKISG